uniref:Virilizer N-terminal domain-containing protein n=1 Tax=Oryza meridionalis TaxID=40149 RepID=A0A0E0D2Q1_9ORYZ
MGRPEPVVLFAQTILHSQLDEYVDEAIVTNHLVLRGTYRSLTLVIYGNTAEDLGQFNIELDLDHSLANVVSSPSEGKLEDLPPALHSSKFTFEESLSSLKPLSLQATELDLSIEVKKILLLALTMYQIPNVENLIPNLQSAVISAVFKYMPASTNCMSRNWNRDPANCFAEDNVDSQGTSNTLLMEASNELFDIWKNVNSIVDNITFDDNGLAFRLEELPSTKHLFTLFDSCFPYYRNCSLLDLECPFQSAVVNIVSNLPSEELSSDGVNFLSSASIELAELLKMINMCVPIEDPSPVLTARRICKFGHLEGLLSYNLTIGLITSSKYSFLQFDADPYMLSLIQERGFFPLSAALLSSPVLRLASGPAAEILMEIASSIEALVLSLLFCRSGLSFLLGQPEATELILLSLQDREDMSKTECMTLRQAFVLLSKGFFCRPQEVAMITELHLKVGSAANRLLAVPPNSDELLWALHSSSPGSNRKDAPTRLLEWIDAGVVYKRNGAVGLLRYSAILASGGDAHLSSGNVLVSDSMDVENVVADPNNTDGQVIDNLLGKLVADKYFDGVALCSTSVVQLTTAFRILAFISEEKAVASSLFEEGAINVIYVVLMNCKSMLERLSNSYDYLVDEGAELSSTTELLLDRTHEQTLVDLMIPSLVLLINLLHILNETKEQYRNKKLLTALLQLHREGDLFPDEGIWLWKVEVPSLTAIRSLSTGTVLGCQVEKHMNWYLHPEHVSILLVRLMPQLDRLACVIDNFATSALTVIQDMLRIFIVRIASEKIECAVVLLRPIFIWLNNKVDETSLSEREIFKVHQLLQFIAKLSEHPNGKALLCKMGVARILRKLLQECSSMCYMEDNMISDKGVYSNDLLMLRWKIPLLRSIASIFSSRPSSKEPTTVEELWNENACVEECSSIMYHLLMLCQTFQEKICQGFDNWSPYVGKPLLHQVRSSVRLLCSIIENSGPFTDSVRMVLEESTIPVGVFHNIVMTSHLMPSIDFVSVNDEPALLFTNAWKAFGDFAEPFGCQVSDFSKRMVWELPDCSIDKQLIPSQSARRKLALGDSASRRVRDNQTHEPSGQFSRGLNTPSASIGHTRRDTFRQRKPNTSRPPSMHVDDYVARERNIEGASSASNIVSSTPRGALSGRPPSIHVDEFMARQRERQNPVLAPSGDATQVRSKATLDDNVSTKPEKPRQPKADLDDDQEINIIFDEESGSDDKLPFPQPDDSLQSPPVIIGENSPGPVVDETENQQNGINLFSGTVVSESDEACETGISSQTAIRQESNIPSERKFSVSSPEKVMFPDHADESPFISPTTGSKVIPGYSTHAAQATLRQLPPNMHRKRSPHKLAESSVSSGSHGHDRTLYNNQPPLPPMPPPVSSTSLQNPDSIQRQPSSYIARDGPPPFPPSYLMQSFDACMPSFVGHQVQTENVLPSTGDSSSNALPSVDAKFLWSTLPVNRIPMEHLSSGSSTRPVSPLPLRPVLATQHAAMNSGPPGSLYNQGGSGVLQPSPPASLINDATLGTNPASGGALASNSLPSLASQFIIGRPSTPPFFGTPLQIQLSSGLAQSVSNPQPSLSSMQPRAPPPPPQQPHPSQTFQGSLQLPQEQPMPYPLNAIQPQVPLQFLNQLHVPQLQFYHQTQQESVLQPIGHVSEQPIGQSAQQQTDSGMNLNHFFSSPEAIQSLLSDRDKLCKLLEQNPKLMQMLQDRIGQL